ncbi:ester cyclase [Dyadobacter sp. CY107]|uniref:ester cyclase n=1 Tax=Dyadobacter fanqingshengii TaxID=2906443 RepID=UPI001F44B476|nr:ester cyclase [Dyadobacter fanqingshengii]MCF2501803.1 ester cyclase [Dyadobacter fanqingshengii]
MMALETNTPALSKTEANKAIVRRYWFDFWNEKNINVLNEIAVEDVTFHFPPGQAHQPPTLKKWFETALVAFPDVHFTLHDELAEGDKVVSRWSYEATNTGNFLGRETTSIRVRDQGIDIFRIENGKIVEMWVAQDSLGLLQQLKVIQ